MLVREVEVEDDACVHFFVEGERFFSVLDNLRLAQL